MIYDCFSFFNELDLLEVRLNTLKDVVDRFVISESNFTHTGKPKPLYFSENKARYSAFSNKIIHIISPDPETPSRATSDFDYSWACENIQRNATVEAIKFQLKPCDVLIISDLDEIPNPEAIKKAIKLNCPVRLRQKFYYYYFNYRNCTTPYWHSGSVILSALAFNDSATYQSVLKGPHLQENVNTGPTATRVRFLKGINVLSEGGWHFSYLGGAEKIKEKLSSIVEGKQSQNISDAFITACIASGRDVYGRGEWFFAESVNQDFPSVIAEFPQYIYPVTSNYLRSVRGKRLAAYLKWIFRPLFWKVVPSPLARFLSQRLVAFTMPQQR